MISTLKLSFFSYLYQFPVALRGSPDSFSTSSDGGPAPLAPLVPLLGRNFIHEPPGEPRQVCMKRHKSQEGLGFSIRGGSEHGVGIYVSLVEPGSLAQKQGLRVGDQILKVNDKTFDNFTHAEAVKVRAVLVLYSVLYTVLYAVLYTVLYIYLLDFFSLCGFKMCKCDYVMDSKTW
uniref:PDZ domain-containing protein n=1 Tax=Periophthalmus magnuspinnatus TaxID=409849 RepID=A0A3B3ZCR4_9GOBI